MNEILATVDPAAVLMLFAAVTVGGPILGFLLSSIWYWLDDGESAHYPNPFVRYVYGPLFGFTYNGKKYVWKKNGEVADGDDIGGVCLAALFVACFVGTPVLFICIREPVVGICIAIVVGVLMVTKKVIRISKRLAKHMADKEAHK